MSFSKSLNYLAGLSIGLPAMFFSLPLFASNAVEYRSGPTQHSAAPRYSSEAPPSERYPQAQHPGYNHYQNYGPGPVYPGYGGGYVAPMVVDPYPPADSQPGMSDDSNELYQSYLRSHGQGY